MAQRQSIQNCPAVEKPSSAAAVRKTLTTVTQRVVKRFVSRPESRLEQMVPPAISMDMMPAASRGMPQARRLVGQAAPRRE